MTPKQQVLAKHPTAKLQIDTIRCCYVVVVDGKVLGESHGGHGRAWRNAALAI